MATSAVIHVTFAVTQWAEPQPVGARAISVRHVDELVAVVSLVSAFGA